MIINEEIFAIESQCDHMLALVRNSDAMHRFNLAKEALEGSKEAQEKIMHFNHIKTKFEKIEAYGSYAPGFQELRTKLFASKRAMDLDDVIYDYRIAERDLQVQLDLIAKKLATAVSDNILVSAGDAFSLSMIGLPAACEIHLGKRRDIEL